MSPPTVFAVVLVFTLLTVGYLKGLRFVERHSPDDLVKFHFIMVAVRFLFAVTAVGIYMLFAASREDALRFAALILGLYLTMIVVTIILKH